MGFGLRFNYSDPSAHIGKLVRCQWDDPSWFQLRIEAQRMMIADLDEDLVAIEQLADKIQLMPHQIKTAIKVKNFMKNRAILADEVGLGKTIEAGILIKENICRGLARRILILTPASLTSQWKEEMATKFSEEFVVASHSASSFKGFDYHDRIIASIDMAKRGITNERISSLSWDMLIVDEAHRLKNRSSLAHQLVKNISARYLLLLTATPVQNDLSELYNLVYLVKPDLLGTWNSFKENFIQDQNIRSVKNSHQLQKILTQVMVRTRKIETEQYITYTKRYPITHRLDSTIEEQILYNKVTEFIRRHFIQAHQKQESRESLIFSLMILQRQLASSTAALVKALQNRISNSVNPQETLELSRLLNEALDIKEDTKIQAVLNILTETSSKVIIFTTFLETQKEISRVLSSHNIQNTLFFGSMTQDEREASLQRFQEDIPVLICTEAGSEGLNLQFCNLIVNYDLPWNPMRVEQRIGRIHRIGQNKDVYIHNLVNQDTIEDYILTLLYDKIKLFELTIGDIELILGDEVEHLERKIFDSYMTAKNVESFHNRLGVLRDKTLEKKAVVEELMEFDQRVFENFDLTPLK